MECGSGNSRLFDLNRHVPLLLILFLGRSVKVTRNHDIQLKAIISLSYCFVNFIYSLMLKYFLTLVASSASVVALLLATNFSWFYSYVSTISEPNHSVIKSEAIDLNIANLNLGLTNSHPHILDANLGCSCSACLKFS